MVACYFLAFPLVSFCVDLDCIILVAVCLLCAVSAPPILKLDCCHLSLITQLSSLPMISLSLFILPQYPFVFCGIVL